MRRLSPGSKLAIVPILAALIILVPGCRRGQEEVEEEPAVEVSEIQLEADVLELPQQNPEIGITLNATPPGLVATLNTEYWIEVTDARKPEIVYSFVATLPVSPGITPATVADFEAWVRKSPDGKITDTGSTDTALGSAEWASGTYMDDDGIVDDIHLFVPHPSGTGTFTLFSVCPKGVASAKDRLVVMQELLANIS